MKILLLDNYDSFTYNLLHAVKELGATDVEVVRNDQINLDEVERFDKIILSPGPGIPEEAGLLLPIIKRYAPTKSILGVCLGHQSIGAAFGGRVIRAPQLRHGKTSPITHLNVGIFAGVPSPFTATRYHSLIVEESSLPSDLEATAWSDDGLIMGLRHRTLPIEGVQFHPESIMTEHGKVLLANFLSIAKPELAEVRG